MNSQQFFENPKFGILSSNKTIYSEHFRDKQWFCVGAFLIRNMLLKTFVFDFKK